MIVHPRLEALYAHPSRRDQTGVAKISSGIRELDELLEGGVPAASTTVVMGPSGSGKTTASISWRNPDPRNRGCCSGSTRPPNGSQPKQEAFARYWHQSSKMATSK
jgi:circadian clock protein KaiC